MEPGNLFSKKLPVTRCRWSVDHTLSREIVTSFFFPLPWESLKIVFWILLALNSAGSGVSRDFMEYLEKKSLPKGKVKILCKSEVLDHVLILAENQAARRKREREQMSNDSDRAHL